MIIVTFFARERPTRLTHISIAEILLVYGGQAARTANSASQQLPINLFYSINELIFICTISFSIDAFLFANRICFISDSDKFLIVHSESNYCVFELDALTTKKSIWC